ncbi:MAG: chromate transporter [Acholeplasmataceae bacterium]
MTEKKGVYKEIMAVFLKLGIFAFGGPAAHVAMMESEIVEKRQWITKEAFIDMLGFTSLIPGPNSTEMAILLGHARGGKKGLFLAGFSFILPAALIVLAFAYVYQTFGNIPEVSGVFQGILPVILAIILQAVYRLAKTVLKTIEAVIVTAVILTLSLLGMTEILLLMIAVIAIFFYKKVIAEKKTRVIDPISLFSLFLIFLKIGAILYGSGYVLIAFLNTELVQGLGLITSQQLVDAVAIGQFTPGPVFTTATFIGYLIYGIPGAIVATIGIFLPAFLIIFFFHGFIEKMRASRHVSYVLDGLNAAAIALMLSVTIQLGLTSLTTLLGLGIFLASGFLLIRFKVNATYLILIGALVGLLTVML